MYGPKLRLTILLCSALAATGRAETAYSPATLRSPAVAREFRGVWIATVGNIDWPSKPGLSTEQQQAELLRILDRAAQLRLNAVILQVRPSGDVFYDSPYEPWSEYLTGVMGRAPQPYYDPLAFAVAAAHDRGLELHAWFNPFRARHTSARSPVAAKHLSRRQPGLVRPYGSLVWADPGERAARDHVVKVIRDVVHRYDIDAVHLDDYFYPYPEKDAAGKELPFPDWPSWKKYLATGGKLKRDDWRRENVNHFVHSLAQAIKAEKPRVQFGISPFGIWRPGFPPSVRGFDAYAKLYADARKWLEQGWVDYLVPQLYWRVGDKEQSYPVLLRWWSEQNPKQRHLWAGNSVRHGATELVQQIQLTRHQTGASGNVLWGLDLLDDSSAGVAEVLSRQVYANPALVPATPWLDARSPAAPELMVEHRGARGVAARWRSAGGESSWLWILQTRRGSEWTTRVVPATRMAVEFTADTVPDAISVTAVDRSGNTSAPTSVQRHDLAAVEMRSR